MFQRHTKFLNYIQWSIFNEKGFSSSQLIAQTDTSKK